MTTNTIQRAALNFIGKMPGLPGALARLTVHFTVRSRSALGADERARATTVAIELRSLLDEDTREMLDLACGREPDAGQAKVLETAGRWIGAGGTT